MYCGKCGTMVSDNGRFCPKCGAPIQPVNTAEATQVVAPEPTPHAPEATPASATTPKRAPSRSETYNEYQSPAPSKAIEQQPQASQAPAAPAEKMPSKGLAFFLIVVGFACGVIWGVVGITQYQSMKKAIEAGDAKTAKEKFNFILIITIVGVIINFLVIMPSLAGGLNS